MKKRKIHDFFHPVSSTLQLVLLLSMGILALGDPVPYSSLELCDEFEYCAEAVCSTCLRQSCSDPKKSIKKRFQEGCCNVTEARSHPPCIDICSADGVIKKILRYDSERSILTTLCPEGYIIRNCTVCRPCIPSMCRHRADKEVFDDQCRQQLGSDHPKVKQCDDFWNKSEGGTSEDTGQVRSPAIQTTTPATTPANQTTTPAIQTTMPATMPANQTITPATTPANQTTTPATTPAIQTTTPATAPANQTITPATTPANQPTIVGIIFGCSIVVAIAIAIADWKWNKSRCRKWLKAFCCSHFINNRLDEVAPQDRNNLGTSAGIQECSLSVADLNTTGLPAQPSSYNGRTQLIPDDPSTESTSIENQQLESVSTESQHLQSVSTENQHLQSVSTENQQLESVSTDNQQLESVSTENQHLQSVSTENQQLESVSTNNQQLESVSTENQQLESVSTENQPLQSVSTDNQQLESVSTENQPLQSVSIENQPLQSVSTENQHLQSVSTENQQLESVSTENQQLESVSTENQPLLSVSTEIQEQQLEYVSLNRGEERANLLFYS